MFESLSSNLRVSFHTENIYLKETYAITGEDIVVQNFFSKTPKGFYLDIGAHHPFRFSNTYLLYKAGWHGVNIDASQDSIDLLEKYRPRDLNLKFAVSNKQEELIFHTNSLGAMNTMDNAFFKKNQSTYSDSEIVQTQTISNILDGISSKISSIDFLSIDLEGYDLRVVKSFPFELYRPRLICIEDHSFDFMNPFESDIVKFLNGHNYRIHAFVPNTLIFKAD